MTNKDAIYILSGLKRSLNEYCGLNNNGQKAFDMAISALQAQEVKKLGCTYKPDCPWYDGSKCNSPNDHGYHECDYDRGIFPESYEEEIKNSAESSITQKVLDTISRQEAIEGITVLAVTNHKQVTVDLLETLPSAQPEPSEITDEQAILHLQSTGWMQNHDREMYESGLRKQLADDSGGYGSLIPSDLSGYSDRLWRSALWRLAYERGKADANDEIIHCQDCIHAIKDGLCGGYWCKGKAVKSSHYCGYAERRTDEGSD